jgi:hypothetical protein
VSSRAKTIRGGGGGIMDGREDETRIGDIDLDLDWARGEGTGDSEGGRRPYPAQLGMRTISSVSNVRASMTWRSDVCCHLS